MQRLKTRPQFQATLAGSTVSRTAHFALHRLTLEADSLQAGAQADAEHPGPGTSPSQPGPQALFVVSDVWLGAMVPKRWARRAATRNAIKRQIYAVASTFEARLPRAAHVVRLRTAFDRKQFVSAQSEPLKKAVRAELLQLFGYAVRRVVGTPEQSAGPGAHAPTAAPSESSAPC